MASVCWNALPGGAGGPKPPPRGHGVLWVLLLAVLQSPRRAGCGTGAHGSGVDTRGCGGHRLGRRARLEQVCATVTGVLLVRVCGYGEYTLLIAAAFIDSRRRAPRRQAGGGYDHRNVGRLQLLRASVRLDVVLQRRQVSAASVLHTVSTKYGPYEHCTVRQPWNPTLDACLGVSTKHVSGAPALRWCYLRALGSTVLEEQQRGVAPHTVGGADVLLHSAVDLGDVGTQARV